MTLTELLARVSGSRLIRVRNDSRKVQPGDVFVAVRGAHADGHTFIEQAVRQGAKYIVAERPMVLPSSVELILVQDSSAALGQLAQASYGNPNSRLTNLAVTGTNGKSTIGYLVRSVLNTAGLPCGLIGTIQYDLIGEIIDSPLTTPDPLTLAEAAAKMVEHGGRFMMIEASSHALDQNRLAGISFSAAAFTNLTGDHLDYHKTMDAYLAAKTKLFTGLPIHALAVLNADSDASAQIAAKINRRILWYSTHKEADITAEIESMDSIGSEFYLVFRNIKEKVQTPLPGLHNISNHLAAAGLCFAVGLDVSTVAAGLSALQAVPGRLEPILCGQAQEAGIRVFVDYAHTDDALRNVLTTLRPLCSGRLVVVFGCGGDRDKTKRPRMAQVAQALADWVIVTSDNPRTEEPNSIIQDIVKGFTDSFRTQSVVIEPDRRKAIRLAIHEAKEGDIVLIAGKGHENYQIIGTQKTHFSDQEEALRALSEL
ncbi:MAG TPA: UDP-N-acetylmuramoyl-L-alanyl-D-glutamate--2,6-diaminopimelate ligase [Anaerohalosphaeraceae bacterium]|nr:UDP-N-acetylmuramoyl-L-alanyl-D-glutamate--2,6-diaminopimelate ligase [Anaerohalosphaeraceae bacterium]HOL88381.1 UDP-N-acetylmuramoyl-L-alanyl-D-glutamate--2,6-diaminopimelate ligase [Anaerohalosphaeraceae bacterium]HPP55033.1 UDP-N-acetylmuramoyl-L-alanyl-D-glutamate--2,6-diaminopimelate ligase [Anaerohalosphaeraceae bacterium]